MMKRTVIIKELKDGWELNWNGTSGSDDSEFYKSAVEAQNAIKDMGRVLSNAGTSSIFVIEWYPISKIGRQVVEVLQE